MNAVFFCTLFVFDVCVCVCVIRIRGIKTMGKKKRKVKGMIEFCTKNKQNFKKSFFKYFLSRMLCNVQLYFVSFLVFVFVLFCSFSLFLFFVVF